MEGAVCASARPITISVQKAQLMWTKQLSRARHGEWPACWPEEAKRLNSIGMNRAVDDARQRSEVGGAVYM